MPKIAYINKRISASRLATIAKANVIIAEYERQGFQLTLRQLYYQFVARDYIANNQREYDNLGATINDGRLVGLIDWDAIVDRTRNLQSVSHWDNPSQIMRAVSQQYRIDKWEGQPFRPEVWIEKDAVAGVVEGVCQQEDVAYFSCRGYTSQSEMWAAAMRMKRHIADGQTPVILHFGDHDPSGMDMTRDIIGRLEMFMGGLEVQRLALNWAQIERYNPPPNFAKVSDSRAKAYIEKFGDSSWELDALEPRVLVDLIRTAVQGMRDQELWDARVDRETTHRDLLGRASDRWSDVAELVSDEDEE